MFVEEKKKNFTQLMFVILLPIKFRVMSNTTEWVKYEAYIYIYIYIYSEINGQTQTTLATPL